MNRALIDERIKQLSEYIDVLNIGNLYIKSKQHDNKLLQTIILKVCQRTLEMALNLIADTYTHLNKDKRMEQNLGWKGPKSMHYLKMNEIEEIHLIQIQEKDFYQQLDDFIKYLIDFENCVKTYVA